MAKVLLDTDILSEIIKERDLVVRENARIYLEGNDALSFSSVSAGELLFGLYSKDARDQLRKATVFLKSHTEIVPTSEDYWLLAKIKASLRKSGNPIGDADVLIAACSINANLVIATGNTKHYQAISHAGYNVSLTNWRESAADVKS